MVWLICFAVSGISTLSKLSRQRSYNLRFDNLIKLKAIIVKKYFLDFLQTWSKTDRSTKKKKIFIENVGCLQTSQGPSGCGSLLLHGRLHEEVQGVNRGPLRILESHCRGWFGFGFWHLTFLRKNCQLKSCRLVVSASIIEFVRTNLSLT